MDFALFSIKRPVLIFGVIILMVSTGIFALSKMGVDLYPDISFPMVTITTAYPGAGPTSVERQISKPLESSLSSLAGLKKLHSQSMDGVSVVMAEFAMGTDVREAESQIRAKVDQARVFFPQDVEKPLIMRLDPDASSILRLVVFADLPPGDLYNIADKEILPQLERINNVGAVYIVGGLKSQVHIDLDRNQLNAFALSATQIASRIGGAGEDTPLGVFASKDIETTYRFSGEFSSLKEIENVIVNFGVDPGSSVLLKEMADIKWGLEDTQTLGYLYERKSADTKNKDSVQSAQPRGALFIDLYKKSGSNTVSVVSDAKDVITNLQDKLQKLPGKPRTIIVQDMSRPIWLNIEDVIVTIVLAILLTIVVVYVFMGNVRSTLITAFAIPNSIIGTFILMYLMDFTINVMTLLALSLVVGLLVDDAIVVRENIFSKMQDGMGALQAAHLGTKEVSMAVIATSLTVIAVFLPMGFLSGIIGQFFMQFGFTVVFAIIISTFDGLMIAPMLSAYFSGNITKGKSKVFEYFDRFQVKMAESYSGFIRLCLNWKKSTLLVTTVLFVLSLLSMSFVKQTFLPANETGEFSLAIKMPSSSNLDYSRRITLAIENNLRKIPEIDKLISVVGGRNQEKNIASISVVLVDSGDRDLSTADIKEKVRNGLHVPEGVSVSINDGGGAAAFQLQLRGENLDELSAYAQKLLPKLSKVADLVDLKGDFENGKEIFQIKLDPSIAELTGVQPVVAGREIRMQISGQKVGRLSDGDIDTDIVLRVKEDQRNLQEAFPSIRVPNATGRQIPLSQIARSEKVVGSSIINRQDRTRVLTISANLRPDGAIVSATEAAQKIILEELPPPKGVAFSFAGQAEDMKELGQNMIIAFGFGILFIYLVLAALYESFVTPLTILVAIPPALSGAFLSLLITGEMFNIFSMIGMIMLLGIVTKNSILLVDHAMQGVRSGLDPDSAMVQAGSRRLRPILMTAISMVAGTLPIALGIGEAAKSRSSMGVVIIGGLIVSTLITLILVPILFGWFEKLRVRLESRFSKGLLYKGEEK